MDIRKYIKRPCESADVQINSKQPKIAEEGSELANVQAGTEPNRGSLNPDGVMPLFLQTFQRLPLLGSVPPCALDITSMQNKINIFLVFSNSSVL